MKGRFRNILDGIKTEDTKQRTVHQKTADCSEYGNRMGCNPQYVEFVFSMRKCKNLDA